MKGGPERFTYGMEVEDEKEELNLEQSINEIPSNFNFVHIANPENEDEELIKIEDRTVPLNFKF
jgi:predicted nuclease of restriction endonuclease-like (RecB) superfamily